MVWRPWLQVSKRIQDRFIWAYIASYRNIYLKYEQAHNRPVAYLCLWSYLWSPYWYRMCHSHAIRTTIIPFDSFVNRWSLMRKRIGDVYKLSHVRQPLWCSVVVQSYKCSQFFIQFWNFMNKIGENMSCAIKSKENVKIGYVDRWIANQRYFMKPINVE